MPEPEIVFLYEELPGGGYTARACGYAIFTQAATLPELVVMIDDAVQCHFDERDRSAVIRLEEAPER